MFPDREVYEALQQGHFTPNRTWGDRSKRFGKLRTGRVGSKRPVFLEELRRGAYGVATYGPRVGISVSR